MSNLSDRTSGRYNNYHLLRMVAAMMVLASHSVAIATGDTSREPLRQWLGVTPGTIAVDVFFIISGLLVTQSMERRATALTFIRARFLGIWPGLTVALLLSVFVLDLALTTLPFREYLSHQQTWRYLVTNLLVFYRTAWDLPGVFPTNPLPDTVNGSLWTLRHEVRSYAYLLLTWLSAQRILGRPQLLRWFVLALAVLTGLQHAVGISTGTVESSSWRLYAMFAMGSLMYQFRTHVQLRTSWWLTCLLVLAFSTLNQRAFGYVYSFLLPYVVVWVAYANLGMLSAYNRLEDYSYGTYIYAFPIQQSTALLWPAGGLIGTAGLSSVLTLLLALASWHWVEKPAMALKFRRKATTTLEPV